MYGNSVYAKHFPHLLEGTEKERILINCKRLGRRFKYSGLPILFMPYCQKCGNKIEENDEFCPVCGEKARLEKLVERVIEKAPKIIEIERRGEETKPKKQGILSNRCFLLELFVLL
jgi:RNA polymerase subunit RPABC4/transcription elongation factor Spt4